MTRLHTCSDCGDMSPTPVCDDCQQERRERSKARHPSAQRTEDGER